MSWYTLPCAGLNRYCRSDVHEVGKTFRHTDTRINTHVYVHTYKHTQTDGSARAHIHTHT